MYCATSFWEREKSSNRERMYVERARWPCGGSGGAVELADGFMGSVCFDARPRRSFSREVNAGGGDRGRESAPGAGAA
jgi:hypothetical protein